MSDSYDNLRDLINSTKISEEWTPEIQQRQQEADRLEAEINIALHRSEIPISVELIFDTVPYSMLSLDLRKEWFRRGYGLGRTLAMCDWPRNRMSRKEYYDWRREARSEADLSDCPYFTGSGTCIHGCREEPSCITDRPEEGWPSERRPV